jgi:acyl-CoA thioesterase-1
MGPSRASARQCWPCAALACLSPEEVTVVALGDSLTQGYGLVEEEGFVPQLQAWLQARGT